MDRMMEWGRLLSNKRLGQEGQPHRKDDRTEFHPAPFKAQNMALNSYATPEGLEIGRAQAAQAEAAMIPCHVDMNPILLKPQSDNTSQVVLNGVAIGNRDAYSYFRGEGKDWLRREACEAFDRLAARFSPSR